MKTTIRYAGGKSKAINKIKPYISKDIKRLVSPFFGGGSLEIIIGSELNIPVLGFDIFDILVNFWNVQINKPIELYNFLLTLKPNTETYNIVKDKLKKWNKSQKLYDKLQTNYYKDESIELTDIEGAAYYWFNHNLSYGPMFMGWASSVYVGDNSNIQKKYINAIEKIKNFKCNLNIKEQSFEKTITQYKNDFMYLDPPYFLDKNSDNKMFKGIYPNPNYDIHHTGFDHEKLRDLLLKHEGGFVMSYNNCEIIREWYKDFELYYPEWNYSMGNGETRIGKNKENNNPKKSHEILIVKRNMIDNT